MSPADDPVVGDGAATARLRAAVRATHRGELCWTDATGRPQVHLVVPLLPPADASSPDGVVVLSLPYAELEVARAVAAAGVCALALPGRPGQGAGPVLVQARVELVEDPTGERSAGTLGQHLAKHPPSRALADSVILRREHWWYVPRLLVRLHVTAVHGMPGRPDARHHPLLVVSVPHDGRDDGHDDRQDDGHDDGQADGPAGGGHDDGQRARPPQVLVATADGSPAGHTAHAAPDGPALLLAHEASDDLERTVQLVVRGRTAGGALVPDDGPPVPTLPPLPAAPGLLARWSRQRALRRACEDGLRAAGHG